MEKLNLPVSIIKPSADNSRKINKKSVEGLVASIKETGLLQPILVRQYRSHKKKGTPDYYEVIAGHRRLEAVKQLKMPTIDAILVSVDDKTAKAMQVTENIQRTDLTAFEEAEAIEQLIKLGHDTKQIASMLGRTASVIALRKKLLNLSPKWKKAVKQKPFNVWPVVCFELIARYEHNTQDQYLKEFKGHRFHYDERITEKDIRNYLNSESMVLLNAGWKLDDETLVPAAGSCKDCTKRSGCQQDIFSGLESDKKIKDKDLCLDRECWNTKKQAHIDRQVEDIKAKHGKKVTFVSDEWISVPDKFKGQTLLSRYSYTEVKKKSPGAKPAIIVHSDNNKNIGKLIYISTSGSGSSATTSRKKAKGQKMSQKEREERLEGRRLTLVINQLKTHNHLPPKDIRNYKLMTVLTLIFGIHVDVWCTLGIGKKYDDFLKEGNQKKVFDKFNDELSRRIGRYLNSFRIAADAVKYKDDLVLLSDILDFDFDAAYKNACEKIPTPKSWAKETIKTYNKSKKKVVKKPAKSKKAKKKR